MEQFLFCYILQHTQHQLSPILMFLTFCFVHPSLGKFLLNNFEKQKYTKSDHSFLCTSYARIISLWSTLVQELGRQYLVSLLFLIIKPIDVSYSFLF